MRRSLALFTRPSIAALMLLGASPCLAVDVPEVEPNEIKAQATPATLACGDSVSGTTTGTATTAGATSVDKFLITGPTDAPGVYEYTLTLTSPVAGHTATIRGLSQANRVITAATDSSFQTSQTVGTDRINRWYGFGNGGQIYYQVAGTTTTTSPYTATLSCMPVTVTPITGMIVPGSITVKPSAATDTALDTDFWVYDSNFNVVPTFGHDDADGTGATRTLAAGTYYIAFGPYNVSNNQPAATDDTFTGPIVLDFPNVIAQTTTTATSTGVTVEVQSSAGTVSGTSARSRSFEIVWFSFVVQPSSSPSGAGSSAPNPVAQGQSAALTISVTPAIGSTLDNITSVTADVSALSGNPAQTAVAFTRVPATSNWTYNVPVVNGNAGTAQVNFTIVDPQAAGGNGAGNFAVTVTATSGACCNGDICTQTNGPGPCTASGGTFIGYSVGCGGGPLPQNFNATPMPIPEYAGPPPAPATPVTSTVNVTDASVITDLNVYVKINHTWGGDVYIRLQGPNGTVVDLFKRPGAADPCNPGDIGNGNDLNGTYVFDDQAGTTLHAALIAGPSPVASGNYIPSTCAGVATSLNAAGPTGFGGVSAAGTWTLIVSDEDEGITGTLQEFGLIINGVQQATPCGGNGACCCGATCSLTSAASCTGTNQYFAGNGTVCNAPGNNTAPCCLGDYNHSGGANGQVTVQDVFDFLGGFFSNDPCADVNNSGGPTPITVQDVFDYLSLFFGAAPGGC